MRSLTSLEIAVVIFTAQLGLIVGLLVQRELRRRAEEESRKSDERYRSVVDAQSDLICRYLNDTTLTFVNEAYCRFWNKKREELLGTKFVELIPPSARPAVLERIGRLKSGTDAHEHQVTLPDGTIGWHHWVNHALVGPDGQVREFQAVGRDVTDAKRAEVRNRALAGRLIAGQETERARIARDLHDGVCQEIAAVSVDLSYLRQHADALQGAEAREVLLAVERRTAGVAESLRQMSHGLHSSVLQHVGLVSALHSHCAEVERQHRVHVTFHADGDVEPASAPVALSLFRIVQEALANAARHGRARHASVSLERNGTHLALTVTDDGKGFDVVAATQNGGLGLLSIEERARLFAGDVSVRSQLGSGTTVAVRLPLEIVDRSHGTESEHHAHVQWPDRRRFVGFA